MEADSLVVGVLRRPFLLLPLVVSLFLLLLLCELLQRVPEGLLREGDPHRSTQRQCTAVVWLLDRPQRSVCTLGESVSSLPRDGGGLGVWGRSGKLFELNWENVIDFVEQQIDFDFVEKKT